MSRDWIFPSSIWGISEIIIHQIFSLMRNWSKHVTWLNIPQPKLGNIREYSPIFKTVRVAKKIWRMIKTIASIWGENMLGYFVVEHYLFLVAHSFPRASLSENCLLLGTDNARGQISAHIFAPNGDYCLYIPQFWKLCMLRKRFIWRIINTIASIWAKICWYICLWTLSVPQSSQFSLCYILGKLFASRNR